jgi:hypothetical protein
VQASSRSLAPVQCGGCPTTPRRGAMARRSLQP